MTTANFGLQQDAFGRLVLIDAEGQRHVGVEPIRDFPLSDPQHWISILDAEGREIVCVEDLAALVPAVRQVLEEELARREFVPIVERIEKVTATDPAEWHVKTDRGPTTFMLKNEEDVRRLGSQSVLVIDDHGIRYLIPDLHTLDAASRRILDRYL